ncbi:unnamed protein product [Mytilus edulis]|uniref:Uncharacterized protein n=1 Tax=Mytilus edulis TaxID=6550 RepID=A0A8S3SP81_MYTED|nr:unnamed protein product [Mytilus edulis]
MLNRLERTASHVHNFVRRQRNEGTGLNEAEDDDDDFDFDMNAQPAVPLVDQAAGTSGKETLLEERALVATQNAEFQQSLITDQEKVRRLQNARKEIEENEKKMLEVVMEGESPENEELDDTSSSDEEIVLDKEASGSNPAISSNLTLPLDQGNEEIGESGIPQVSNQEFQVEFENVHENAMNAEYQYCCHSKPSTDKLQMALKSFAKEVLGNRVDGSMRMVIRRQTALNDALQNVARAQNRLLQPISVRFIGESAVDEGGPSRELSSEIVVQIKHSSCVEAILLLQGGQGLPIFNHSVAHYIIYEKITNCHEDLPKNMRKAFDQLKDMSNNQISRCIDNLLPNRFEEGYSVPSCLQIGGLLEVLRSHQKESYSLFKGSDVHLTAVVFENMLKFKYDMIIPGSNNMAIAQAIEQGCFLLLQAAESGEAKFLVDETSLNVTLSSILKWLTGATQFQLWDLIQKLKSYLILQLYYLV